MRARLVTCVLVLASCAARAADFRGAGRIWAGLGFDSNARRDYTSAGSPTPSDGFAFGLGHLQGALTFAERFRLLGSYDLAGRKFLLAPSEDTVVQDANLELTAAVGRTLALGVLGRARDRRGAERDYSDLVGGLVLDFLPSDELDVRVTFGAHRFLFWQRFAYSYFGPEGTLSARYRFNRRHSVAVFGSFMPRTYNANATPPPVEGAPPPAIMRADSFLTAGVTYAYRGPFQVAASYGYFDQTSNSYGETIRRHRLSVTGGVQLPLSVTLLSSLTAQFSNFPQGVYLSPELTVVEDDETASSLTVKLVRPLSKRVDLDVRYAGYLNFLPQNDFRYLRHVVSAGVAVSFP